MAPKVVGSSPSSYPLKTFLFNFFFFINYFFSNFKNIFIYFSLSFLNKINFLTNYYTLNDLIWQEGLLFDFLQKKIVDNWIKKFLIYSAYLFNERLVFDSLTRFYLNFFIWPMHKFFFFEANNISNTLFLNLFFFFLFSLLFFFYFFIILMF